jgi:hypothetical protein
LDNAIFKIMSRELLVRYLRLAIGESRNANVPTQLIEPDSVDDNDKRNLDQVDEFSGAVAGYTAPLGMSPDKLGRKKNKKR